MTLRDYKKEIFVGFVTFIFGGVFVFLFQNYIDRPRPEISVKDVSFDNNSGELIEINNKYLGKNDDFVAFTKYMTYKDILLQENKIGNLIDRMKELKIEIKKWQNENDLLSSDNTLPINFDNFPIFNNDDYANIFTSCIRKITIQEMPTSSDELKKLNSIQALNIDQKDNNLTVFLNANEYHVEGFPRNDSDIPIFNNLIFSFRTSNKKNFNFYCNKLSHHIDERLNYYQDFILSLQELLIECSRIKINITIFNNGKDAVVLHPYFRLDVFNDKNIEKNYLMNTINSERDDMKPLTNQMDEMISLLRSSEEIFNENKRKKPINSYSSFFQDRKTYQHISIPGGTNFTVVLETNVNLKDKGKEIKQWFESGALFCRINGLTVDNNTIESPEILFNSDIQDKIKTKLGF